MPNTPGPGGGDFPERSLTPEGQKIVEAVRSTETELPTLSSVVFELNRLTDDPIASSKDFEAIIMRDPALSAKVLQVANSVYYSAGSGVTSIRMAIVRIGMSGIQDLAMSISLVNTFGKKSKTSEVSIEELWRHSLGVAVSAAALARACPVPTAAEDAFTGGMLHDIGKAILIELDPDLFIRLVQTSHEQNITFREAEQKILGVSHDEIGELYAKFRNFPPRLLPALARHHLPALDNDYTRLDLVVHVADVVVNRLGVGDSGNGAMPAMISSAITRLRIDKAALPDLIAQACAQVDNLLTVLL
ncbi:MAG: HDOD domain-containing protein [Proteobacteria bacterium]|nr:HDOD domain-containing protein [Pseudomonadota bacterium]